MHVTPDQIRAARAMLRMEQGELARQARVSVATIRRLEAADGKQQVTAATVEEVQRALERAGAEFIPAGVRRRFDRSDKAALFEELRAISLRSAERLKGTDRLTDADLYDENGLPA